MSRIFILHKFIDGPWGGGNQFLKALRATWRANGVYTENLEDADVLLFNSHHRLDEVAILRQQLPRAIFVHRVDGPVFRVRGATPEVDRDIFAANAALADATIFQSEWSRRANQEDGMPENRFTTTITNAPDPAFFHPPPKREPINNRRVKLIASSWSSNIRKGFEVYGWLDQNLDFNKVQMTFAGNSPVDFHNIARLGPLPSADLADLLRNHDIYIQASGNEPCSNALLEALHCGLPAIVRHDGGGNPELLGQAGETFQEPRDIPALIERIAADLDGYRKKINNPTIDKIAKLYYEFISGVIAARDAGDYTPKQPSPAQIKTFLESLSRGEKSRKPLWRRAARRIKRLLK